MKPTTHQDLRATLPQALRPLAGEKRWVNWRWELRTNKDGVSKWTKAPLQPRYPRAYARSNDPSTWGDYELALRRVTDGDADGLGLTLLGSGVGAVDLDRCCIFDIKSNKLRSVAPWADAIWKEANNCYVEVTVSGTGLRIVGRASGSEMHRCFDLPDGAGIELFRDTARYITVSGLQFGKCRELLSIDALLNELLARYDIKPKKSARSRGTSTGGQNQDGVPRGPMNSSTSWLITKLGGNLRSGKCPCPAHDDDNPSLHVEDGDSTSTMFCCHGGCSQADVIDALSGLGLWPLPGAPKGSTRKPTEEYSEAQQRDWEARRRGYARSILNDAVARNGRRLAQARLRPYFARRGIPQVPPTALLALPGDGRRLPGDAPAMLFPVIDGIEAISCHVTWLSADLTTKRDPSFGPQRITIAPVSGGYIELFKGELDPRSKLVIAEGIETALAAAQIAAGCPAISAVSAKNMLKINPPPAAQYFVCADNDGVGGPGIPAARALADRLVLAGHKVRFAIPPRPNSDWNDELLLLLGRIKHEKVRAATAKREEEEVAPSPRKRAGRQPQTQRPGW